MHWRKLLEGCKLYRQLEPRDYVYVDHMKKRGGDSLPDPDEFNDRYAQDVIDFINSWATRSPMQPTELRAGYQHAHPWLRELHLQQLENTSLDLAVRDSSTVADCVAEAFDAIATCGSRKESTGASKILHTLLPRLFVMWDMRIAGGYGLCREATQPRPSGREYAFCSLPRLLKELEEALISYAKENVCNKTEAGAELVRLGGGRPIPKLLDEFNYAKYTLSLDQLWDRI